MTKRTLIVLLLLFSLAGTCLGGNDPRNFGGVGIDGVPRADGSIVVRQLVLGGPAQTAGIRVGDVITRIDGKATRGSNFKDMVEHRLRGRAGTRIVLKVWRPQGARSLTFTLTRRQLELPGAHDRGVPGR